MCRRPSAKLPSRTSAKARRAIARAMLPATFPPLDATDLQRFSYTCCLWSRYKTLSNLEAMDCLLCKVSIATQPNNVASDLAMSHSASPHSRWTSARGSDAEILVESARYQLPMILKSSLIGKGMYKTCWSNNASVGPWQIHRAAAGTSAFCLRWLRLCIWHPDTVEVSTGLGIDSLGMAVDSAAGTTCSFRDMWSIARCCAWSGGGESGLI
jgi:hypothetical protein